MTQNTKERIEAVVEYSGMSMNQFAKHIGLKRGENIYQIQRGNNGISLDVADRICTKFPEIDELWLLTGKGQMLRTDVPTGVWSTIGTPNSEAFRGWVSGLVLPAIIAMRNGNVDAIALAVEYAQQLQAALAKEGGKQ